MKKSIVLSLCVALLLAIAAAVCSLPTIKYKKVVAMIPMRDSVSLYTVIYQPRWGKNHPILITRTPYSVAPYDNKVPRDFNTDYRTLCYTLRGYILVFQDVRGRFMSQGEFENIRPASHPINEATDAYDTVEWLVNNIENNNGAVGFTGCSYPGFYAMYGALSNHPAVKASSPQAPVTDWFLGDDMHHNGVMMIADSFSFMPVMSHTNHQPTTEWEPTRLHDYSPDQYTFFRAATRDSLRSVMHPSTFWDTISSHPDYDQWWQSRNVRRYMHNIKPAMLIVGGTFDAEDCYGAWNSYRAICNQSPQTTCHLVIGPWAHGAWGNRKAHRLGNENFGRKASYKYYIDNFELPFFEYHLRGKGSANAIPPISVFSSGSNRWHHPASLSSTESYNSRLYLDGSALTATAPTSEQSVSYISNPDNPVPYNTPSTHRSREYMVADQRFTDGRDDVVRFVSEPLAADMTILSAIKVNLNISCTTTDVDLVVRIIDLHPEDGSQKAGYQMLVRGDIMRARYRDSFSAPQPLTPNQKTTVSFTLSDIAHTFRASHRIMVCVQSSWFPLAERSPQQFVELWHCRADEFIPATVTIHNDSNIEFNTLCDN